MEFLTEYGLFFAKIVTFVVAASWSLISVILSAAQKDQDDHEGEGELKIRKLNEKYRKLRESIQARLMSARNARLSKRPGKKKTRPKQKAAKAKRRKPVMQDENPSPKRLRPGF